MEIIQVKNLSKHFKLLNRHEGLIGAAKDLFSKDYKIIKAVDNISMSIDEGEIVGFVGPNGAGKSTTIKMLTGVMEPTSGEMIVNGYVPYKNRTRYIKDVGVVFGQRTQLWWDIPVVESFKLLKAIYKIDNKRYEDNMNVFNDLVKIKELYPIPVRNLSLGQRMLCDIAASFLHNPKIIFLDEPTIGLDISVKNKIRGMIKNLNEIKRTTILLTSHDIGDIEKLCKRIVIIDKGTIIHEGDTKSFNNIFGSYRTLKVAVDDCSEEYFNKLSSDIHNHFKISEPFKIMQKDDGWIDVTINQEHVMLLDVLNFFIKNHDIKDVKVEEIEFETVIEKVYQGGLS